MANKPITEEVAVLHSVRDVWRSYPSNGLTPQKLSAILRMADDGFVAEQSELAEEMLEKDGHLTSVQQKRVLSLVGAPIEVQPADESDEAKKVADFVSERLMKVKRWHEGLAAIMNALLPGFAVVEIMWAWDKIDRVWNVERLSHVESRRFNITLSGQVRLLTPEQPVYGVELPPNKFIVHRYSAKAGLLQRSGLVRAIAWPYLFKAFAKKDWAGFLDRFGHPWAIGKYTTGATEKDIATLKDAVRRLMVDASAVISEQTMIELVNAIQNASGSNPELYRVACAFWDAEMSKAMLGETLTTDAGERGARSLGEVHEGVRQDLLEADAMSLQETLFDQLTTPLVRYNLGESAPVPHLQFQVKPPADLNAEAQRDKVLFIDMGLPVEKEYLYNKYNVPRPTRGEDLLERPDPNPSPEEPDSGNDQRAEENERANRAPGGAPRRPFRQARSERWQRPGLRVRPWVT